MLKPDELGSFILVLANSMQDTELQKQLSTDLEKTFNSLKNNNKLTASADDKAVFDALVKTGISKYGAWQVNHIDDWICAYNPLRALRPARSSNQAFEGLHQPFNKEGFHFSKPFLKPEILSKEVFEDTPLQVMYHKFPFAPYHLLIVVEAAKFRAQFLDKKTHELVWNLVTHTEDQIKHFGLAYNSLGAGASINQLHLHGFINNDFAVEKAYWKHNDGGSVGDYPLNVSRFDSADQSWAMIETCHLKQQPYNLLYRSGCCYLIQRKPQGAAMLPDWLPSLGWYEACGGFNLSDESYTESLTADSIELALLSFK